MAECLSGAAELSGSLNQPHRPGELGYYDLRLPETRERQAELAQEYGVHGFCYHYYWFSGRRILDKPLNDVLKSGKPEFPFCISWANENWTRTWDGGDKDILLAQNYDPSEYIAFIKDLIPVLSDDRYIRVDGKPLLLVYRVDLIPDIKTAIDIWRREAERAGLRGIYLAAVQFWGSMIPGLMVLTQRWSFRRTIISAIIRR